MAKNEDNKVLLPACSPDLKSPEQCAFREGKIFSDGNYRLSRLEKATSYGGQVKVSVNGLLDFCLGTLGSTPHSRDHANLCYEGCPLTNCEYHLKK